MFLVVAVVLRVHQYVVEVDNITDSIPTYTTLRPKSIPPNSMQLWGQDSSKSSANHPKNTRSSTIRRRSRSGNYSPLCTGSLISNSDESSVVEQTLVCSALWLLLLLLFLDFGSLRLDFTGTGKRAVLFTLDTALVVQLKQGKCGGGRYHDGRTLTWLTVLWSWGLVFKEQSRVLP